MTRVVQPLGVRGSLKWIQRAVNNCPSVLDAPILKGIGDANAIEWRSPLARDQYAEYRDAAFVERIGCGHLVTDLAAFWPARGPQWDALAITNRNAVLLVEAKAHIAEMLSPATQAGELSRARIAAALMETIDAMGAKPKADWCDTFFQLANRFAHLHFLRSRGINAYLALVSFVGDEEMRGPASAAEWAAAYEVAMHVMGVPAKHNYARYVVHLHPRVADLA